MRARQRYLSRRRVSQWIPRKCSFCGNRKADVEALINAQISKVWPRDEVFNLALTKTDCAGGAMVVSFDGARVRKGGNSSAYGIKRTATFATAHSITIQVTTAD